MFERIQSLFKAIGRLPPFPLVIQSDETECGLASLAMVLSSFGCSCELERLRGIYGSTRGGMTVGDLCDFAAVVGLRGIPEAVGVDNLNTTPSIIFCRNDHFSVFWKLGKHKAEKRYFIADPSDGILCFCEDEMKEYYSGIQIRFRPIKRILDSQVLELPDRRASPTLSSLLLNKSTIVGIICLLAVVSTVLTLVNAAAQDVFMTYVVEEGEILWIKGLIIITVVLSILIALSGLMMQLAVQRQLQHAIQKWNIDLFESLFRAPYIFFINKTTGLISSRFSQVEEALSGYQSAMLSAFTGCLNLAAYVVAVMFVSPPLALVSGFGIAAFVVVGLKFYGYNIQNNYIVREAECLVATAEFKLIKSREQIILEHSEKAINRELNSGYTSLGKAQLSASRISAISEFFLGSVDQSLNALLLVVSSILIVNGYLTTGTYAAINVIIGTALEPIRSLSQLLETYQNSRLTFNSASELMPAEETKQGNFNIPKQSGAIGGQQSAVIQLDAVSFRYSKYSEPILNNANLTIKSKSGRPIAVRLDGQSGSGKSTFLNLLMGFIQPVSGRVLIDGICLKHLKVNDLREIVQYIDRSALISVGSVESNARLGTQANHDEYEEILMLLGLNHESIFCQHNSRILQNESSVSTGQAVMISLVRAALMKPRLLLIDESLVSIPQDLHQPIVQGLLKLGMNLLIVQHGESPFLRTLPSVSMADLNPEEHN